MGKIYYIMGKSSSGKDTLFRKIKQELPMLQTVTLYTTRPKREGEREGVEYHFVTDEQMHIFERQGKVVELRTYNTVHGAWKYATIEDGQVNLAESDYLMIGTLESYGKLKKYYGAAYLVPVYIEVEDGERLNRALTRAAAGSATLRGDVQKISRRYGRFFRGASESCGNKEALLQ